MNKVLQEDIDQFTLNSFIIEKLTGKSIIITGSTGLIGSVMVRCLNGLSIGIRMILPVRNQKKAESIFRGSDESIEIIETELVDFFMSHNDRVDYVIHCASPTSGSYINEHPLETFRLATETTDSILNYAARVNCESVVYLSSIEYYGVVTDDELLTEDKKGYIDNYSSRSSYPIGKQAAEYITYCYSKEYGVNVKVARLTQTLGAGASLDDRRVFMQFTRSISRGEDIVLHTLGNSAKPYCYTTDSIRAIIYILLYGNSGEAYNVATPGTYISIKGLAEFLRTEFNPAINVVVNMDSNGCYAPETRTNLCVDKLLNLGWRPQYDLRSMFERLIRSIQD